jgi:outer membrane protein assembly factor BamB
MRSILFLGLVLSVTGPASAATWPVFGYDPSRSGFNSSERTLTVANVHRLHARWQISLGGVADSTPIFLDHVRIGRTFHSMLFQTRKDGTTLGIEASSGHVLWRFSTTGPNITTSTPVADPSGQSIYVPGVDGKVRKLSAAKGRDQRAPGFPARITRMPQTEKDASALNLANGYLYATTSGYLGDATPYDGHVVSVNLSSGATSVFNSLCSNQHRLPGPHSCPDQRSGIWSRGGAVVDPDSSMNGRIYVSTGNGDFDANVGGHNYGDSVISVSADLSTILGSYTPTNYDQLENNDTDLGSTSPAMLPQQPSSQTPWMLVQGGKDSLLKLVNRAALPGVGNELQLINLPTELFATPAVWTVPSNNAWVFIAFPRSVQGYRLQTNSHGVSQLVKMWDVSPGQTGGEGTSPVIANGIVFVAFDNALVALNARNGNLLWSSAHVGAGHSIGPVHWESPIVVNGSVYCSDENGQLTAYSLR